MHIGLCVYCSIFVKATFSALYTSAPRKVSPTMESKKRNIIIAVIIVVVLLILWWAYSNCYLGKYSAKKCESKTGAKGKFCCGTVPHPAAVAEAKGLYALGVRPERFCGGMSSPAAIAEYQALKQAGGLPEHFSANHCGGTRSVAIAEAHGLQSAQALKPGAPYYTKSHFTSVYGNLSSEATRGGLEEAEVLRRLQASSDLDDMSSQKMMRDKSAYHILKAKRNALRTSPAFVSARQARNDSMSEGFGGPAKGYGWIPQLDETAPSSIRCLVRCNDGCNGSSCQEYCNSRCRLS